MIALACRMRRRIREEFRDEKRALILDMAAVAHTAPDLARFTFTPPELTRSILEDLVREGHVTRFDFVGRPPRWQRKDQRS